MKYLIKWTEKHEGIIEASTQEAAESFAHDGALWEKLCDNDSFLDFNIVEVTSAKLDENE